jgi:prolyl oligopeptidase
VFMHFRARLVFSFSMVSLVFLAVVGAAQAPSLPPPATAKHPVTDVYHGLTVTDNYRWLEDGNDPAVKRWSAAENNRTREYLDHLPARAAIKERLQELITGGSVRYFGLAYRGGTLFAMKDQPPRQQPFLVGMRSAEQPSTEKVIIDTNTMGENIAIDFYVPSLDGKLVAASLSENGSEDGAARIFDVGTGKELGDRVPRVNFGTAGGSIAWKADGSGFYYTRYPENNERAAEDANFYQQVYFHKLGSDSREDTYVIGKDFPRIAEIQLHTSDDGRWLLAEVANGDGGQFAHYLMDASGRWTRVTDFDDEISRAKLGSPGDHALYLLSHKDAPRGKVMRLPLADRRRTKARAIVAESPGSSTDETASASITDFEPTPSRLYVLDMIGGPSRVRIFDHEGNPKSALPMPPISSVREVVHTEGDDVIFRVSTYLQPSAWFQFDSAASQAARTALFETSPIKFADAELVREFAISNDGTRVPLNIIRRKGTALNASHPTLLEGYGGYQISLSPVFLGSFGRVWLDQGGVYAIVNLRGGGEYGEEWHKAGNLTHKQNVFDDFIACAQHLIDRQYTSPAHLAILGGSTAACSWVRPSPSAPICFVPWFRLSGSTTCSG